MWNRIIFPRTRSLNYVLNNCVFSHEISYGFNLKTDSNSNSYCFKLNIDVEGKKLTIGCVLTNTMGMDAKIILKKNIYQMGITIRAEEKDVSSGGCNCEICKE